MTASRWLAAFSVLGATLVLGATPVLAGHTWNAAGVATCDGDPYRLTFSGHLDQLGPPGSAIFSLSIYRPDPTPQNPQGIAVLEAASFNGLTNFLDAMTQPVPAAVVQADYWAELESNTTSFRMDGVRSTQTVTATGHYQACELYVGPQAVSA